MEELICKSCKYYNGQCQNFYLSRREKNVRRKGNGCEYWKARPSKPEVGLKAKLLDLAIQLEKIAYELKDDEE